MTVKIYTDGSCIGNPGPGGCAAIIYVDRREHSIVASDQNTTNQRMEVMAAILALEFLDGNREVEIYSDSLYLVNTMTKGWKKKTNKDLWGQLEEVAARHKVKWIWIRGHNGHPENTRVDKLAGKAARKAMAHIGLGGPAGPRMETR